MILEKKPVTMAEVQEIMGKIEDENQQLKEYLKKFNKLKKAKADELFKELTSLGNVKLKEEHLVKMVDFLPKTNEELHKVVSDANLSEEETNGILEIIKRY